MVHFRPSHHREPIADCPQPDGREIELSDIVQPVGYAGPPSIRAPKLGVDNMRIALRRIAGIGDGEVREVALRALAYDKRMRGEA